jgi:hypothetical protein
MSTEAPAQQRPKDPTKDEIAAQLREAKQYIASLERTLKEHQEKLANIEHRAEHELNHSASLSGPYIELQQREKPNFIWFGAAEEGFGYEIRTGFELDHAYHFQMLRNRAIAGVDEAFNPKYLGPIDPITGFPNMSTLPKFNPKHQLCVKVWIEEASEI